MDLKVGEGDENELSPEGSKRSPEGTPFPCCKGQYGHAPRLRHFAFQIQGLLNYTSAKYFKKAEDSVFLSSSQGNIYFEIFSLFLSYQNGHRN